MSKNSLDLEEVVGIWAVAMVIVFAVATLFLSWFFSSDERKYVMRKVNQCDITKEVPRYDLDKVYCGKACRRYLVEYTYWCARENKTLIFVQ